MSSARGLGTPPNICGKLPTCVSQHGFSHDEAYNDTTMLEYAKAAICEMLLSHMKEELDSRVFRYRITSKRL